MAKTKSIEGTVEAWETKLLGNDDEFAKLSTDLSIDDIEDSVGLKSISIRMKKTLIDDLKLIAKREGLGYQPLIKRMLQRFVDFELKAFARQKLSEGANADEEEYEEGYQKTA